MVLIACRTLFSSWTSWARWPDPSATQTAPARAPVALALAAPTQAVLVAAARHPVQALIMREYRCFKIRI